jgi:hypothetical protein
MKKIFIILIINLLPFTKVESQINYTVSINTSGLNISSSIQSTIPMNCTYNNTPLVISSNQTWNDVTIVNSDITINSGATLTINNKTYLNQSATFTVSNGATLIVNGSILGGCDASDIWRGTFIVELGGIATINSW